MNKKFQQFFNLNILHSYFVNNVCTVLTLSPIAETKRKMRQLDILLNDHDNVFALYASYNADLGFSWTSLTNVLDELYFFILDGDNNFLNYTNIPMVISSSNTYYFTNTSGSTSVQKQAAVSAADYVSLTDLQFSYPIPTTTSLAVKIVDSYGKTVINQTVNGQEQSTFQVELTPFGSGYYQLYLNGKLKQSFMAVADMVPSNCFGVLRVDLKAISAEQAKKLPLNCQLNFETRSTYWQYQIVVAPSRQIKVEKMTITSSEGYTYSGPTQQPVVGGNQASVYISTTPIPLEQQSGNSQTLKIIYKNQFSSRKNEMDVKLPFPDVSSIEEKKGKKKQVNYISNKLVYV